MVIGREAKGAAGKLEYVRAVSVGEVGPGEMKAVEVGGVAVLICNVNGEYYAVHDECTHECFPLSEGTLAGDSIICLLHGARFDVRSGEVLALPAYSGLKTYGIRIEGDDILVAVE